MCVYVCVIAGFQLQTPKMGKCSTYMDVVENVQKGNLLLFICRLRQTCSRKWLAGQKKKLSGSQPHGWLTIHSSLFHSLHHMIVFFAEFMFYPMYPSCTIM